MTRLDVSNLTAGDAEVALRSYPRRYRSAFGAVPDDGSGAADVIDGLALRVGPDGHSALDLLTDTVRSLEVIAQAMHGVVYNEGVAVHPGAVDADARHWEQPVAGTVEGGLALLDAAALELATAVERVPPKGWSRTAPVAGTDGERTVTAVDVLREAVRTAADNLAGIEKTLTAVST